MVAKTRLVEIVEVQEAPLMEILDAEEEAKLMEILDA